MVTHAWDYYDAVTARVQTETYDSLKRAGFLRRLPPDVRRSLKEAFDALRTIATLTPIARTRLDYDRAEGGSVKKALEIFLKVKLTAQAGLTTIPRARDALGAWLQSHRETEGGAS